MLVKAWCSYDAVGFVQEPLLGSDKSRLTSYGLTTMVLFIFNRFEVEHPLEALAHFFTYFKNFNWKRFVLTLYGPVNVATATTTTTTIPASAVAGQDGSSSSGGENGGAGGSNGGGGGVGSGGGAGGGNSKGLPAVTGGDDAGVPHISFAAAAAACKFTPLLPLEVVEHHHATMQQCKATSAGKLSAHSDAAARFQARHVNILDPLDDTNNIGRSVSKLGALEMAHAFASGRPTRPDPIRQPAVRLQSACLHAFLWPSSPSPRRFAAVAVVVVVVVVVVAVVLMHVSVACLPPTCPRVPAKTR
jgi:hypothetical protein